jgi:hypothetical protein
MALCATGLSQTLGSVHTGGHTIKLSALKQAGKPTPVFAVPSSKFKLGPQPISYRKVMMVGNQIIPLGPSIPYSGKASGSHKRFVGSMILDCYEGTYTANGGGTPVDELYGEDYGFGSGRYYYNSSSGQPWAEPLSAAHFYQLSRDGVNSDSANIQVLCADNTTVGYTNTNIQYIELFTGNQGTASTSSISMTSFNSGVEWSFGGSGIPPGYYANLNLTSSAVPVDFPAAGANGLGFYVQFYLNSTFTGTVSPATESQNSQPWLWTTKPLDGSKVDSLQFLDGNGNVGSQTGGFGYYLTGEYTDYSTISTYTVTRGKETSTHAITNLDNTDGADVVVLQKFQPVLTYNNAEISATVNVPSYSSTDTMFRALAIAKTTSAGPVGGKGAAMNMYLQNYVTSASAGSPQYDLVRTIAPIVQATSGFDFDWSSSGTFSGQADGTAFMAATAGADGTVAPQNGNPIGDYITTANITSQANVRFGVHQPAPATIGWTLTCNFLGVEYGNFDPGPLAPMAAYSAP